MNMHLRQCFARAKLFRLKRIKKKKILTGIFDFQELALATDDGTTAFILKKYVKTW